MIVAVALCSQLLMLQLVVAKDCSGFTTKPLNLVLLILQLSANDCCRCTMSSVVNLQLVVANDWCRCTIFSVVNVTTGSSKRLSLHYFLSC